MGGISKEIFIDHRYVQRHLPNTPQVRKLLRRGRAAHVFHDEKTMIKVAQAIIEKGEYIEAAFETTSVTDYYLLSRLALEYLQMAQPFHFSMAR